MSSAPPRDRRPRGPLEPADRRRAQAARRTRRRTALLAVAGVLVAGVGAAVWLTRDDGGPAAGGAAAESDGAAAAAPRVSVRAPTPTLPMPARTTLAVRLQGGAGDVQMRMLAQTPDGRRRAAGPWVAAGPTAAVPPQIAAIGRTGPLRAWLEVRDEEGRVARSGSVVMTAPLPPGPAEVVGSVATRRPFVALVLDDGLDGPAIARIVATLRAREASATYCFNGKNMSVWSPGTFKLIRGAVLDGTLEMCSHGWSHETSTGTTYDQALTDLRDNAAMDRAIGISSVPYYRPPYGAISEGILQAAGKLGYRYVLMWSIDPSDYLRPPVPELATRVVSEARPGAIAVMHAIGNTADALPAILAGLKAKGLRAVTTSTLISSGRPLGWGSYGRRPDATGASPAPSGAGDGGSAT